MPAQENLQTRKFIYYNDTGRDVSVHPGTDDKVSFREPSLTIESGAYMEFSYPENFTPMIKMWDYGKLGLQIIVMLVEEKGGN